MCTKDNPLQKSGSEELKDNGMVFLTMLEMSTAWQKKAGKYRNGEISENEYFE